MGLDFALLTKKATAVWSFQSILGLDLALLTKKATTLIISINFGFRFCFFNQKSYKFLFTMFAFLLFLVSCLDSDHPSVTLKMQLLF